jgi:uncharacterized protein
MHVLLTGGTGLIGSRLGISLVRAGHTVTSLTRSGKAADLPFPTRCVQWNHQDVLAKDLLFGNNQAYDAVIHLAGETVAQRWTKRARERIRSSRLESTRALIESLSQGHSTPPIWINASAIGFYGDAGSVQLTETSDRGTGFLSDLCFDWEAELKVLSPGTRAVSVRFGVVLALVGGALPKMLGPVQYGLGGNIGSGKQWISWIHVDDAVRAILHVLGQDVIFGPVNVVAPEALTNAKFTEKLTSTLKMPRFISVPKIMLKAVLGEMSTILLESANVFPTKLLDTGFVFSFPNLQSAFDHLFGANPMKGVHNFQAFQWINKPVDETFDFFSRAENLEKITPPELAFKITGKSSSEMGRGLLIDYTLRIKKIPIRWRTKIESWNPPHSFVDTQLRGPYRIWHHTHSFEQLGDGTLMSDVVRYKMHAWPFGDVALPFVQGDIASIFSYRKKVIGKIV